MHTTFSQSQADERSYGKTQVGRQGLPILLLNGATARNQGARQVDVRAAGGTAVAGGMAGVALELPGMG